MKILIKDLYRYPEFISTLWDNITYNVREIDIMSFDSVELVMLEGKPDIKWKWDVIEI